MSDDELNEHEEWCAFRESVIGGGDAPCDCGWDLSSPRMLADMAAHDVRTANWFGEVPA